MTYSDESHLRTDPLSGNTGILPGPNLFGNRMELQVHPAPENAMREWRDLEERLGNDSISCNWEWTQEWIRQFGSTVPYQILSAREQGIVRGMCLLTFPTVTVGPFSIRTVHLGTSGEPDQDSLCIEYNRLMVEEIYRKPMAFSLLKYLRDDPSWDLLSFEGLAEEEADVLIEAEPEFSLSIKESPYCDLTDTGEPLFNRLGGTTRTGLRRKLKQWGTLKVEWAEDINQAEQIYEELISLHQARWEGIGKAGSFSSLPFRQFHWEMIKTYLRTQKVSLIRISHGRTTIGCVLSYIERGTLLFYQMGANLEHAKLSPGMIAIYAAMEEASRRGFKRFDFLAGQGEHKRRMSTGSNRLVWANFQRPSMKVSALQNLRQAKRLFIGE